MIRHKVFGWIPDLPVQRDFLYSAINSRIKLSREVVLSFFYPAAEAQERFWSIRK